MHAQVKTLLHHESIELSRSPYAAPVIFVTKKTGEMRMVFDYRALNSIIVKSRYPLPRIEDIFDKLAGSKFFSCLDLQQGYHPIRIPDSDREKTAFRTPMGLYQFKVLTFGLTNGPAPFQAEMNRILEPVLSVCVVFLDDICIHSMTLSDHLLHLEMVFKILRKEKLFSKFSKCTFAVHELKFLGHIIGQDGIKVDPAKISVIKNWPISTCMSEVRSFLGLANYFRKFVLGFSTLVAPLTSLTSANTPWNWCCKCQVAFDTVISMLINAPLLQLPDFEKPFKIISDASLVGTGAVLLQEDKPIAFTSSKFIPAERGYTTTEQELLGVIRALQAWRCYVEGGKFPVLLVTDHNPLTFLRSQSTFSRRQARWVEYLERFHYEWKYIQGTSMLRIPCPVYLLYSCH